MILQVDGIDVAFGGVQALRGVSLSLDEKRLVGLVGPNGAGKSTLFNVISGLQRPDAGTVTFDGDDITRLGPGRRFTRGMSRTFQLPEVVTELSVLDNVLLGVNRRGGTGLMSQALRLPWYRRREAAARATCLEMLELVGLADSADTGVGGLPLGDIRRLELARSLASRPRLLLFDELASGLTDEELAPIEAAFQFARDELGATILLVEHNVRWVMDVADEVTVLARGQVLTSGTPDVVRTDPAVIEAYLGSGHGATA